MPDRTPVPKQPEKPGVELTLTADSQDVLEITVRNNGKKTLELPYRATPLEHFVVDLHGEKGKQYEVRHAAKDVDQAEPGTLTVPAGGSKTLSLHTCHYLPQLGDPGQKVTFTARLKHDGKPIESKPLTVKP